MPNLTFSFETQDHGTVSYEITPYSFLFPETNSVKNETFCHVGIVAQSLTDMNHWTLGQAFMENFYTTFDARDSDHIKIGLTYTVPPKPE